MAIIRFAGEEDAENLLEIYGKYIKTPVTFECSLPPAEEFRRRIRDISSEYPWLVLEEGGRAAGYAYAHRLKEREAYRWDAELSVYLSPEYPGRGLGKRLYGALLELLALQNIRAAYACITAPNPRSEGLHRALGFSDAGRWPKAGYKDGAWHDVIWLVKELAPAESEPAPFLPVGQLGREKIQSVLQKFGAE